MGVETSGEILAGARRPGRQLFLKKEMMAAIGARKKKQWGKLTFLQGKKKHNPADGRRAGGELRAVVS